MIICFNCGIHLGLKHPSDCAAWLLSKNKPTDSTILITRNKFQTKYMFFEVHGDLMKFPISIGFEPETNGYL